MDEDIGDLRVSSVTAPANWRGTFRAVMYETIGDRREPRTETGLGRVTHEHVPIMIE